jgi:hypothetical protein
MLKGMVDTDIMPTGKTINFGWYWETLGQLKTQFQRDCPPTEQPLLQYDNA